MRWLVSAVLLVATLGSCGSFPPATAAGARTAVPSTSAATNPSTAGLDRPHPLDRGTLTIGDRAPHDVDDLRRTVKSMLTESATSPLESPRSMRPMFVTRSKDTGLTAACLTWETPAPQSSAPEQVGDAIEPFRPATLHPTPESRHREPLPVMAEHVFPNYGKSSL